MQQANVLVVLSTVISLALASLHVELDDTLFLAPGLGNGTSGFLSGLGSRRQEGECTIPGGIQCPNAPAYCCPVDYICQPATFHCCPSYGLQCGGLACCDPASASCCPSVSTGCCKIGATCCGAFCCPPGYKCTGGECIPPATATTPTTTRTTSTPVCTLHSGRDIDKRQGGGSACGTPTSSTPTETRKPTGKPLVFDYKKLSQKRKPKYNAQQMKDRQNALSELFTNMCLALEERQKLGSQSEIFEFLEDESKKYQNRKAVGCTGTPCASFPGQSCDEFPFASTKEGGAGAIWNCIPEMAQDIQGGVISSWKSRNKVTEGTVFEFQILNYDCKNPPPIPPVAAVVLEAEFGSFAGTLGRVHQFDTTISNLTSDQDVFPPFDDSDTNNHTIISLGDLAAGSYKITTQVNGTVSSAYVVDSEGAQYGSANTIQHGSSIEISFTIAFENVGLSLIMDTQDDVINYQANLVQVPASTPSPTPTEQPSGAIQLRNGAGGGLVVFLVCLFATLLL